MKSDSIESSPLPKCWIGTGRASTVLFNSNQVVAPGSGDINLQATDASVNRTVRGAGFVSYTYLRQNTNTLSSSFTPTSRPNGVNGQQSLGPIGAAAADGEYLDSINRDTVVVGDTYGLYKFNLSAGGTVGVPVNTCVFDTIGRVQHTYIGSNHLGNTGAAGLTNFYNIGATWQATTESAIHQLKMKIAGQMSNFCYNVAPIGASQTITFRDRINSGYGNLSVPVASGSSTGKFTDFINSTSFVVGDLCNKCVDVPTLNVGTTSAADLFSDCLPNTNYFQPVVAIPTTETTSNAGDAAYYLPLQGRHVKDVIDVQRYKHNFSGFIDLVATYLSANTINSNGKIELIINGNVSSILVTLTASGGALWYEDNVNRAALLVNDLTQLKVTPGTGSGSMNQDYTTCRQGININTQIIGN